MRDGRYEITPIIRYVVNAEFLQSLLTEYEQLADKAAMHQCEQNKEGIMQEMTLDTLFAQGQIRLIEISVFNWGSFHNFRHTARIDPEGTLITGDNGAGKSTFIDGLMALLQPASKASFNVAAAQGDRSDRSLVTYMRGSYGSEHDGSSTKVKSKREKL